MELLLLLSPFRCRLPYLPVIISLSIWGWEWGGCGRVRGRGMGRVKSDCHSFVIVGTRLSGENFGVTTAAAAAAAHSLSRPPLFLPRLRCGALGWSFV